MELRDLQTTMLPCPSFQMYKHTLLHCMRPYQCFCICFSLCFCICVHQKRQVLISSGTAAPVGGLRLLSTNNDFTASEPVTPTMGGPPPPRAEEEQPKLTRRFSIQVPLHP